VSAPDPLTGKQRRKLRALGHHLSAVVHVGQSGVTPALIAAVAQAIQDHELIKVKVGDAPVDRHEAAEQLAQGTGAAVAQVLGNTVLLFRKREKDSKIDV
jgi:RNA-binding protein